MSVSAEVGETDSWGLPRDKYVLYDGPRGLGIEWKLSLGGGRDQYIAWHSGGSAPFVWVFDGDVEALLEAAQKAIRDGEGVQSGRIGARDAVEGIARQAAVSYGVQYLGYSTIRVKTAGTHHIDLLRTMYNWRLVTTPVDRPLLYDRGWCYTGRDSLHRAHAEAYAWPDDEAVRYVPGGWYKEVMTERVQPQFRYE